MENANVEQLTYEQWLKREKSDRPEEIEITKEEIKECEENIRELNKDLIFKNKQIQYLEKRDFSEETNKEIYKTYLRKVKEASKTHNLSLVQRIINKE